MIVFYWGFRNDHAGGVQNLILNITKAYNRYNEKVKIIAYSSSYVYKSAVEHSLSFYYINAEDDFTEQIEPDDIIICFGSLELILNLFIGTNARMFYWSVFPDALVNTFQLKNPFTRNKFSKNNPLTRLLTKKLINQLFHTASACFMDDSHIDVVRLFYPNAPFSAGNLLPIPIEMSHHYARKNISNGDGLIRIAYIGRAESWKIYPFIKLVSDIESSGNLFNSEIYIISEDPERYLSFMDERNISYNGIKFNLIRGQNGSALTDLLAKEIHLLFGMGTALLEACKVGVPAVIIDPHYDLLRDDYLYRFLFTEKGYCLGNPTWLLEKENTGYTFIELINQFVLDKEQYDIICKKSYEYALNNHELSKWAVRFRNDIITNSKLNINSLAWAQKALAIKRLIYNSVKKASEKNEN